MHNDYNKPLQPVKLSQFEALIAYYILKLTFRHIRTFYDYSSIIRHFK